MTEFMHTQLRDFLMSWLMPSVERDGLISSSISNQSGLQNLCHLLFSQLNPYQFNPLVCLCFLHSHGVIARHYNTQQSCLIMPYLTSSLLSVLLTSRFRYAIPKSGSI